LNNLLYFINLLSNRLSQSQPFSSIHSSSSSSRGLQFASSKSSNNSSICSSMISLNEAGSTSLSSPKSSQELLNRKDRYIYTIHPNLQWYNGNIKIFTANFHFIIVCICRVSKASTDYGNC
jgi:hypothetical protein